MKLIYGIEQDDNKQQTSPDYSPADTDVMSDVKHDGNKTNYANQVCAAVGEEE